VIILILVWRWSTFDEDMRKKDISLFVPSDLDLWPLDLKFASLVTHVHRYVSSKLEVSMAFLFRENWRHMTDERRATFNTAQPHKKTNNEQDSKANTVFKCICKLVFPVSPMSPTGLSITIGLIHVADASTCRYITWHKLHSTNVDLVSTAGRWRRWPYVS